jgi:hypothetical protein
MAKQDQHFDWVFCLQAKKRRNQEVGEHLLSVLVLDIMAKWTASDLDQGSIT